MKTSAFAIALCACMSIGMTGCESKEAPKKAPETSKSPIDAVKGAAEKTGEAVKETAEKAKETAGDAAKEAKAKAIAAAESLHQSAKEQYEAISKKISDSTNPQKPVWQGALDGFKAQLDEAGKKLSNLKSDVPDWQTIQTELTSMLTTVNDGLKELASKVTG